MKLSATQTRRITDTLFPTRPSPRYEEFTDTQHTPFTRMEITRAAAKLKAGKSGGPDGVPPEMVKAAVKCRAETILAGMNECLRRGSFPNRWKTGRLVLLPKPGKPPGQPGAYRPLCLLDTAGKLLEQLILARLRTELDGCGGISANQFGFVEGKSTVDAVRHVLDFARNSTRRLPMALFLDVRNAFNSAPWDGILARLKELGISEELRRIIQSYLRDRSTVADTADGSVQIKLTCGVPQGSVLGPVLWNILFDGALRVELPRDCTSIAYADDFAIEIEADDAEVLTAKAEDCYGRIARWARASGLEIEVAKTDAVLLTGRRRVVECTMDLEGHECTTKPHVKYLGVWLSRNGSFTRHVKEQAARAGKALNALGGLLANVRGPGQVARRTIGGAVMSILRYGSGIWAPALTDGQWKVLERVQRRVALRVISGYRTISLEASLVLAGLTPLHLELTGRGLAEWQHEWTTATKGEWTRRLIPELAPWLTRKHGEVNYYLTQVLSGHGNLGAYLARFAIRDTDTCLRCGSAGDRAEHAVFDCHGTMEDRDECGSITGPLTPETLVGTMLASPEKWEAISTLARRVTQ